MKRPKLSDHAKLFEESEKKNLTKLGSREQLRSKNIPDINCDVLFVCLPGSEPLDQLPISGSFGLYLGSFQDDTI